MATGLHLIETLAVAVPVVVAVITAMAAVTVAFAQARANRKFEYNLKEIENLSAILDEYRKKMETYWNKHWESCEADEYHGDTHKYHLIRAGIEFDNDFVRLKHRISNATFTDVLNGKAFEGASIGVNNSAYGEYDELYYRYKLASEIVAELIVRLRATVGQKRQHFELEELKRMLKTEFILD
jgi:hypothetical protein